MTTPLTDAIAQNWINTQTHDPDDRASVQSLVKTLFTHARDLETKLAATNERNGQQLAACSCAAMMDTRETHEQNKTVTKDNPFWSPAFGDVMRRTAECIELREKLAASENERIEAVRRYERAEELADKLSDANKASGARVVELEAALTTAMRQWAGYADEQPDRECPLDESIEMEGEIYRDCRKALRGGT